MNRWGRMLTGRPPFKAPTGEDTLQLVQVAEPVPLRTLVPTCPRDLETIAQQFQAKT